MKNVVIAALQAYKRWISPMLPHACRYMPTCSEYAMEAVYRYGVLRGMVMAAWRVVRCNPLGGHGYDPPGLDFPSSRSTDASDEATATPTLFVKDPASYSQAAKTAHCCSISK